MSSGLASFNLGSHCVASASSLSKDADDPHNHDAHVCDSVVAVLLTLAPTRSRSRRPPSALPWTKPRLWRAGFASLVTVVGENQVLEVVGRQGDWIEVVVPASSSQERRTALISIKQVTLVSGTLPADGTTSAATPGTRPGGLQPLPDPGQRPGFATPPPAASAIGQSQRPALRVPPGHGPSRLRGRELSLLHGERHVRGRLRSARRAFFGGGAEFRLLQGLFLQGAARWFKKTGERVFVLDDEVFPLGSRTR